MDRHVNDSSVGQPARHRDEHRGTACGDAPAANNVSTSENKHCLFHRSRRALNALYLVLGRIVILVTLRTMLALQLPAVTTTALMAVAMTVIVDYSPL